MARKSTTARRNAEKEAQLQQVFLAIQERSPVRCEWCDGIYSVLLFAEWRRIGKKFRWDPFDIERYDDYERLYKNLKKRHRCACKPAGSYDRNWVDQETKEQMSGTRKEGKAAAVSEWYG